MIEAVKSDEILHKLGGRFKLCAVVQSRWKELIRGARPLVERRGHPDLQVVIDEIVQDKVAVDWEKNPQLTKPQEALGRP